MEMSVRMTSTASRSSKARPVSPLSASMTVCPHGVSMSRSTHRTSGSSSITRMRPLRIWRTVVSATSGAESPELMGRRIVKMLPIPTVLSISIVPPWRLTMPQETARPSPVPRAPLVVKKGSSTRRRVSSDMPEPVSSAATITVFASSEIRKTNWPPPGMASSPLMSRFMNTSRSSAEMPATGESVPPSTTTS